jgi:hypothetical protein
MNRIKTFLGLKKFKLRIEIQNILSMYDKSNTYIGDNFRYSDSYINFTVFDHDENNEIETIKYNIAQKFSPYRCFTDRIKYMYENKKKLLFEYDNRSDIDDVDNIRMPFYHDFYCLIKNNSEENPKISTIITTFFKNIIKDTNWENVEEESLSFTKLRNYEYQVYVRDIFQQICKIFDTYTIIVYDISYTYNNTNYKENIYGPKNLIRECLKINDDGLKINEKSPNMDDKNGGKMRRRMKRKSRKNCKRKSNCGRSYRRR